MGHVASKTRSLGQILEKLCLCSRGHIFSKIIMKLCQNVCPDEFQTSSKMGKKLGQILEKPCVCCRSHISSLIIMKLSQNVCLDEISDEFENGSCQLKN